MLCVLCVLCSQVAAEQNCLAHTPFFIVFFVSNNVGIMWKLTKTECETRAKQQRKQIHVFLGFPCSASVSQTMCQGYFVGCIEGNQVVVPLASNHSDCRVIFKAQYRYIDRILLVGKDHF